MSDLNKHFQPSFFSDTDVNTILRSDEQKILTLRRSEHSDIYDTFQQDINSYLTKMPDNVVKQNVRNLLNKNLIYLGVAKIKPDNVIVRSLITTSD